MRPLIAIAFACAVFGVMATTTAADPVQFDASSVFDSDVVVNGADTTQEDVDTVGQAFGTQARIAAAGGDCGADPQGLPNNGFFPANSSHPDVQLAFSETNDGLNATRLLALDDTFTLGVPPDNYAAVHLFATTGNGDTAIVVDQIYAAGPAESDTFDVPDWFNENEGESYRLIDDVDRIQSADPFECQDANDPAIFGFVVTPDPNRQLVSLIVTQTENSGQGVTVFFGATGEPVRDLAVSRAGTGTGSVTSSPAGIDCGSDCGESYTDGQSVTLTATPASGSTFAGWGGACSGTGACQVTMDDDRAVSATFNLAQTPPPPDPDGLPAISGLSIRPKAFEAASSGPSISAIGTTVRYTLDRDATTTFRVEKRAKGRKVGKRCVKPKRSNRSRKACKRWAKVKGKFTHAGSAGANSFRFTGRLRGKKLRPGRYRLLAVAKDAAGKQSRPASARFRILKP